MCHFQIKATCLSLWHCDSWCKFQGSAWFPSAFLPCSLKYNPSLFLLLWECRLVQWTNISLNKFTRQTHEKQTKYPLIWSKREPTSLNAYIRIYSWIYLLTISINNIFFNDFYKSMFNLSVKINSFQKCPKLASHLLFQTLEATYIWEFKMFRRMIYYVPCFI